jgi:putative hydroxymethylpyrimidine transport system substrate-binding protein
MNRTTRRLTLLLAILALTLASCGGNDQDTAEAPDDATDETDTPEDLGAVTVIRDWPVLWPMQMYYEVGLANDYFAEEGLEVAFEFPPDPASVLTLVGTGQAEFGFATTSDVIQGRLQGLDVVVVGAAIPRDMGGIMYYEDSDLQSPADLEGSTVAVYPWPQAQLHFDAMLSEYGISRDDVEVVDAGDYSVPLMVADRVQAADAAVGAEDLDTERETDRDVGVWLYTEHGVPPFYNSLIISNETFVNDNPEAVEAFLSGVYRSINRSLDDPEHAVEITVENHPDADADQFRAGWEEGIVPFADPWPDDEGQPQGYVNADLIQTYMDFLLEGDLIEDEVDPEGFIDLRFLPDA